MKKLKKNKEKKKEKGDEDEMQWLLYKKNLEI